MPWRILAAALTSRWRTSDSIYQTEHVTIATIYALTLICISAFTALTILSIYDQSVPTALWSMPGACVGALAAFLARGRGSERQRNSTQGTPTGSKSPGMPQSGPGQVPGRN